VDLDLAVARFDGEGTAVERFAAARDRPGGEPAWTREVGFVEHHHNGRMLVRGTFAGHYVDVDESDHVSQKRAGEGAVAGGLIGVLLGPPGIALGLLVGGLIGSQSGDPSDVESEPEELAGRLRDAVPRSSSAIVLIAGAHDVDEMLAALGESANDTTRRTLTGDEAAALEASLSGTPPAAAPPRAGWDE
jgi:uncharacterized membrane protein